VDLDCFFERAVVGPSTPGQQVGVQKPTACTCTRLKIVRNSFHVGCIGNAVSAPLHRRACAGVSAFVCGGCRVYLYLFAVGVYAYRYPGHAPVHMQVCTVHRCFLALTCILANTLAAGCVHALVYAQFVYYRWETTVGRVS